MSDLITLPRATVEQALEAWEYINKYGFVLADYEGPMEQAITALKAALEQPEQEQPESRWCSECNEHVTTRCHGDERACVFNWSAIRAAHVGRRSAKPEQAAALEQSEPCTYRCEAWPKCGCAALEQPEQEPVAWMRPDETLCVVREVAEDEGYQLLYTHPPRREWRSLSEEEIYPLYSEPSSDAEMVEFARAIEAALKERNNG
jgi:hypothetical protein